MNAELLATITDPAAVADAESIGLIRVDSDASTVWLGHPMFGEVRRAASVRLRQLRGRIAVELGRNDETDPRELVRRAVLTLDSDLAPDSALLLAGATAAMQLMDLRLTETLAAQAVAVGGGIEAKLTHAVAIAWQERTAEAEALLSELATQTSGPVRAQVGVLRATNFAAILGQVANAEKELDVALPKDDESAQAIADAFRAWIDIARGHAGSGVGRARLVLERPPPSDVAQMLSTWALVSGLGDLGLNDEISAAAEYGYALAERSAEVSHTRFGLALLESYGYRLAGSLTTSAATVARLRQDTRDVPFEQAWHTFLLGMSAMDRGALVEATRSFRESLAYLGTGESGRLIKVIGQCWLATVIAMAGHAAEARREFGAIDWWDCDPDAVMWDLERAVAEAWVCAAEGATSQAISLARAAAQRESDLGRYAREVWCLQAATQFGDDTTADRLAELANRVHGPRVLAATAHATALAAGSGAELVGASQQYERFGDRIAAADAAAQAAVAYRNAARSGSALTAAAVARRLADECEGVSTPALNAAKMPSPLTPRQREIIALAAQGLSNKEIADRLTMSVRSVEGHLLRASQRAGVNGREQLISMLRGTLP